MSATTAICAMTAAACVTLAVVHAGIWLKERTSFAHLGFSVLALGVAGFAWAELAVMHARSAAEAGRAFQWIHASLLVIVLGMVLFVRFYFRAPRAWLGYVALAVRVLVLGVSLTRPTSADFDVIDGVARGSFAGEPVSIVVGQTSVWHWIAQGGFVLLVVFLVDSLIASWRHGGPLERRRAVSVGAATAVFALLGPIWAALVFAGVVQWPHIEFLFFLPAVLVMAYELGDDVLRAARLTGLLQVSERAARDLSGRLINAQEDERRRIARELHDDLSQRLALLSIEVELLGSAPAHEPRERIPHIATAVREVASEIHRLAYQLHPAKLDQLGLVTTARSWCRDLAKQTGLSIEFLADDLPPDLPPDVALCLYRVVQESLQNVIRHSGSSSVQVRLTCDGSRVRLVVSDAGRGFEPAQQHPAGLGLVSMRERVHLLNGTIAIRAARGAGTAVEVTVPLATPAAAAVQRA